MSSQIEWKLCISNYIYTCNYSEALFFPLSYTFHLLCLYDISNNSFVRDIRYSCLVILMKLMKGQLLYSIDEIANSSNLTKKFKVQFILQL